MRRSATSYFACAHDRRTRPARRLGRLDLPGGPVRRRRLRVAAAPSLPPEFNSAVDGIEIKAGVGTCADAAARAAVTITPDIQAAVGVAGARARAEEPGLEAAWSMPIMSSNGRVLGTIGTYFREAPTDGARASGRRAPLQDRCARDRAARGGGGGAQQRRKDGARRARRRRRGVVLPVAVRQADLGRARQSALPLAARRRSHARYLL